MASSDGDDVVDVDGAAEQVVEEVDNTAAAAAIPKSRPPRPPATPAVKFDVSKLPPEELAALLAQVPLQEDGTPSSIGAIGHEAGTCKPCLFYRTKMGCNNGVHCPHCHLRHRRSERQRPCKGKRDRYRKMLVVQEALLAAEEGVQDDADEEEDWEEHAVPSSGNQNGAVRSKKRKRLASDVGEVGSRQDPPTCEQCGSSVATHLGIDACVICKRRRAQAVSAPAAVLPAHQWARPEYPTPTHPGPGSQWAQPVQVAPDYQWSHPAQPAHQYASQWAQPAK